jgi:hypothetical protein
MKIRGTALLSLTAVAACSGAGSTQRGEASRSQGASALTGGAGQTVSATAKVVGSPCHDSDGWVAADLVTSAQVNAAIGAKLQATPIPTGYRGYGEAPTGVLYCARADGGEYPFGYLTANCQANSDCPDGTVCDGDACRMACMSNSDCTAPTKCAPPRGSAGVRYCRWHDNPIFTQKEMD